MKIYRSENVLDAAKRRIAWLFDEFPALVVAFSGGKDSTVVLNLAIEEARRRGRLPLPVMWIDQEAEWQMTRDYVRTQMDRPEVKPLWLQIPMVLANSTSSSDDWLHCWDPAAREDWIRPQEPDSIKTNVYGTERFGELFDAVVAHHWKGQKCAVLGGVRCEESPTRFAGLTSFATYKHVTWGKNLSGKKSGHYAFYPIYDWSYRDVWLAIHSHAWAYCKLYDAQYQHGIAIQDMRVSNVHHETAIGHLQYLQEVEPKTWNRLTRRLKGINTVGQMKEDFTPKTLPPMFASWVEYRDHLVQNLITEPEQRAAFRKTFESLDRRYATMHHLEALWKAQVQSILGNDYHGTRLKNWENKPEITAWRQHQAGKRHPLHAKNKHITGK